MIPGLLAFLAFSGALAVPRTLDAAGILRRAEEIRNPNVDYAADFTIRVVSRNGRLPERQASYTMIAHGKDDTLAMILSPRQLYGGLLLMAADQYWMLLPKASRPFQLSEAQIVQGDVSSGDLARANLARNYVPRLFAEEEIDGEACFKLELTRTQGAAHYPRILYWIAKRKLLPAKLEYYGLTGRLLKAVRYADYRKGHLGLRPMRIEIDSANRWEEQSTLTFSNLRRLNAASVSFTPEGMIPFRDAALRRIEADGREARIEDILPSLVAKARQR